MSNPIYQQYGNGNNDFMSRFQQFKKTFSGNPQQMIQQMLNSGRITQEQLNTAMMKANAFMKLMK